MAVVIIVVMMAMVVMTVVNVEEEARGDARRRPIGDADHRRQGKHEHHCPDQGNATSACSFQSRQHSFRYQPSGGPSAPFGRRATGHEPASLSRDAPNLEANEEGTVAFSGPAPLPALLEAWAVRHELAMNTGPQCLYTLPSKLPPSCRSCCRVAARVANTPRTQTTDCGCYHSWWSCASAGQSGGSPGCEPSTDLPSCPPQMQSRRTQSRCRPSSIGRPIQARGRSHPRPRTGACR
jgi:hypothetical protein